MYKMGFQNKLKKIQVEVSSAWKIEDLIVGFLTDTNYTEKALVTTMVCGQIPILKS